MRKLLFAIGCLGLIGTASAAPTLFYDYQIDPNYKLQFLRSSTGSLKSALFPQLLVSSTGSLQGKFDARYQLIGGYLATSTGALKVLFDANYLRTSTGSLKTFFDANYFRTSTGALKATFFPQLLVSSTGSLRSSLYGFGQGLSKTAGGLVTLNATLSGSLARFTTLSGSTVFAKTALNASGVLVLRGNATLQKSLALPSYPTCTLKTSATGGVLCGSDNTGAPNVSESGVTLVTAATRLNFKDANVEQTGSTIADIYLNLNGTNQGRLTLTSGTPITSVNTSGSTLYFTPYTGNRIALYDGTRWTLYPFTERSLSLTATTDKNYDIFLYNYSGSLTLQQSAAWTDDTTRANAISLQDGVYVKTAEPKKRYLGTIRAVATDKAEDSERKRFVVNWQNAIARKLFTDPGYTDDNAVTNYTHNSNLLYAELNGGTNNKVFFLIPIPGLTAVLEAAIMVDNGAGGFFGGGIAIDSTTQPKASAFAGATAQAFSFPYVETFSTVGYHYSGLIGYTVTAAASLYADLQRLNGGNTKDPFTTYLSGFISG